MNNLSLEKREKLAPYQWQMEELEMEELELPSD